MARSLLMNRASVNKDHMQALADGKEETLFVTSYRLQIVSPFSGHSSSHEKSTTYQNISPGNPLRGCPGSLLSGQSTRLLDWGFEAYSSH